jgi:hypothetical protein
MANGVTQEDILSWVRSLVWNCSRHRGGSFELSTHWGVLP